MSIKNPANVKLQLDEADNMIMIMHDMIKKGVVVPKQDALDRFMEIRKKIQYAINNIQG